MKITKRTVCDPNCHANPKCGLSATIEDGRITAVSAANYPVEGLENRICMMGNSRLEYQYHPDRLKVPLKRVGERGAGRWEEISWDEAIKLFATQQRKIIEKHGSRAVMFSSFTGAFGLLTRGSPLRYAALTGATVGLPGGIDYGVPTGLQYMFGVPAYTFFAPGSHQFSDMANASVALIWGFNPVVTRSVDHLPMKKARRGGTKLICIDPNRSETASLCDELVSLRPGTDGALALAICHRLITQEMLDREFLSRHSDMPFLIKRDDGSILRASEVDSTAEDELLVWCDDQADLVPHKDAANPSLTYEGSVTGPDGTLFEVETVFKQFRQLVAEFSPDKAAEITEIPEERINQLADEYGKAERAAIRVGYGIDRWFHSDCTARAIAALACLTGNIGVPGGGISLSNSPPSVPVRGSNFYAIKGIEPGGALTMMDADRAVRTGDPYPIKMECISLGNPFNQLKPNRERVLKEYIPNLDFIVAIDHFMTDTAKQADLVLPACTIFERTDMVVDSILQLQQRVVEPEGEAKSDFEIFALLAKEMGHGEYFSKAPQEYLNDILNSDDPRLDELDYERLEQEEVIDVMKRTEPWYGFQELQFQTPSGKIEFYKEDQLSHGSALPVYREPVEASPKNPLSKRFPLAFLSAHSRFRIHSTFANMQSTRAREPDPLLRIGGEDARDRSLEDGEVVRVFNDRGSLKIKCKIDERIRKGSVLVAEGHWIDQFIDGDPYQLTHDNYSETAQNYAQYDVLVEVEPLA